MDFPLHIFIYNSIKNSVKVYKHPFQGYLDPRIPIYGVKIGCYHLEILNFMRISLCKCSQFKKLIHIQKTGKIYILYYNILYCSHFFLKGAGRIYQKRHLLLRKRALCKKKGLNRSMKDLVTFLITFLFYQEAKWQPFSRKKGGGLF